MKENMNRKIFWRVRALIHVDRLRVMGSGVWAFPCMRNLQYSMKDSHYFQKELSFLMACTTVFDSDSLSPAPTSPPPLHFLPPRVTVMTASLYSWLPHSRESRKYWPSVLWDRSLTSSLTTGSHGFLWLLVNFLLISMEVFYNLHPHHSEESNKAELISARKESSRAGLTSTAHDPSPTCHPHPIYMDRLQIKEAFWIFFKSTLDPSPATLHPSTW